MPTTCARCSISGGARLEWIWADSIRPNRQAPWTLRRQPRRPPGPPALGRHLDRIIDKLTRASSRDDLPAGLRDEADRILQAAAALRESSARLRGDAKAEAIDLLAGLEEALRVSVRAHAPAEWIASLREDAEVDLGAVQVTARGRCLEPFGGHHCGPLAARPVRAAASRAVNGLIDLQIERPVAGGRMLARHEGQVVFVSGAIPGERVRVRVERRAKNTLFAATVEVLEASADRREPFCDAACGGLAFAHVQYARQLALKSAIVADAFHRIARITLPDPAVTPSPETGYRLRARLHVRNGRPGFFREGTHDWCDAGPTGQLLPESLAAVTDAVRALGANAVLCEAVVVSENVAATERALLFEPVPDGRLPAIARTRPRRCQTPPRHSSARIRRSMPA